MHQFALLVLTLNCYLMIMLFLSKYFHKQQLRNGGSKLFSSLFVRKECRNLTNITRCRNYALTECIKKGNISRALSTQMVMTPLKMDFPAEDKDTFLKLLPNVIKDLTDDAAFSKIPEATKRFSDCLHYNLGTGTLITGLATLTSYKMLEKPENLTEDNIRLATILAWCAELLTTSLILVDDIMDNSETRRNAPCWFRVENIGLTALNDILFLENSCYVLLKKYFSSHPMYTPMMEFFHNTTMHTVKGQSVDCMKYKVEDITLDRYIRSAVHKSFLFFCSSTVLGTYLTGTYTDELYKKIEPILQEFTLFLQIQNDMWDCFGDANLTGKIGTDIQEGRCSWPALIAFQKASPMQRKLMESHYGKPEKMSVEIIRNLYVELNLPAEFATYKDNSFRKICSRIKNVAENERMTALLSAQAQMLFNRKYE